MLGIPSLFSQGVENLKRIKVLFVAANPRDTPTLRLDEEIRAIAEKIRASDYRGLVELVSVWAVRADDLLQALNTHKPHIVHFSGHGNQSGEIVLVGNDGQPKSVSTKVIKSLFTTLKDNIRVVMLNACYSQSQAQAITSVIDCAIGMNTSIGDPAAITFAASFYRAIGFGHSVKQAFEQGKVSLMLEGISEVNTPALLTRNGIDPRNVILINASDVEKGNSQESNSSKLNVDDNLLLMSKVSVSAPKVTEINVNRNSLFHSELDVKSTNDDE